MEVYLKENDKSKLPNNYQKDPLVDLHGSMQL
jgi:hypothetical protein